MLSSNRYDTGGVTEQFNNGNGFWKRTDFTKSYDDISITINKRYSTKPWMVSYDYYNNPNLGWFVLQYNDILDVTSEFVIGKTIKIPTANRLKMSML
jgi:hypothetical protein